MDAITLSAARMVQRGTDAGGIDVTSGWRIIVIAAMSNLVFKAGMAGIIGHRRLLWRIVVLFAVPMATGICLLLFWPTA